MFGRERHEQQIDQELRFHIERQVADYVASGMTPEEARRRAQIEFGGVEQIKEACRDERGGRWLEQFVQDLRYGARVLGRARAAVVVSALVIGLGVGANMAIYSIVDAFLWRPLALPDMDRLVAVAATERGQRNGSAFAPVDYLEWTTATGSFESVSAWASSVGNLAGEGDPEVANGMSVSADLFRTFRVAPMLGRTLTRDDVREDSAAVVVISYGLWLRHFGSSPAVLGKTLEYNERSYRVVGVMPKEFRYQPETDLWIPLVLTPEQRADAARESLAVVARLKPGVSLAQANAELASHAARLASAYPQTHAQRGAQAVSLAEVMNGEEAGGYMYALWAASFLVLLAAIANVANLQFARVSSRSRELAVRSALGAGRLRLIRQLLTENTLLGGLACTAGTLVAYWSVAALRASMPSTLVKFVAGWDQFSVNPQVLAYGLAVAVLAGVLSGVAPALGASAGSLGTTLKEAGRGSSAGRRRHRMRGAFVLLQVSLSMVLLVGAAAVVIRTRQISEPLPNTDPSSALTFRVLLPASRYGGPQRIREFQQRLLASLDALPGVTSAAMIQDLPYSGEAFGANYAVEGRPADSGSSPPFLLQEVASDHYFEAMHIPLVAGRWFDSRDTAEAPPVAIVSDVLAQHEFGGQDPLGGRIRVGPADGNGPWLTIVGVVRHVRHSAENLVPVPMLYRPYRQAPVRGFDVILRPAGPPMAMVKSVLAALHAVDPVQPVYDIRTLQDVYYNQTLGETWSAVLIGGMGGLALLLAAMGVFSVVANAAMERQKEVAIRMTFGARLGSVLWMVVKQGAGLTAVGVVIGVAGGVGFCRLLAAAIPQVEVPGAGLFAAAAAFLMAVAIPACYFPARRAALADPAAVLRDE